MRTGISFRRSQRFNRTAISSCGVKFALRHHHELKRISLNKCFDGQRFVGVGHLSCGKIKYVFKTSIILYRIAARNAEYQLNEVTDNKSSRVYRCFLTIFHKLVW